MFFVRFAKKEVRLLTIFNKKIMITAGIDI